MDDSSKRILLKPLKIEVWSRFYFYCGCVVAVIIVAARIDRNYASDLMQSHHTHKYIDLNHILLHVALLVNMKNQQISMYAHELAGYRMECWCVVHTLLI